MLTNSVYGVALGSDEEAHVHEEILHEALILSKIHHDRILSFRGITVDGSRGELKPVHILFELARGSLRWYLDNIVSGTMTFKEFKRIAVDLLSGLEYMAASGVVHRDLKPANVLVFVDEDHVIFKIGDVGLARFVDVASSVTMSNAGTPLYKAPEVIGGRYGPAADVFSVGVMALEVLATRVIPASRIAAYTSPYQLNELCEYVVKWLSSEGHTVVASLLAACVALDPTLRPRATDVLLAIRAWDVGSGVMAASAVSNPPVACSGERVVDLCDVLDAMKQHGLSALEDAVAEALMDSVDGVPFSKVAPALKAAGVGAAAVLRVMKSLTTPMSPAAASSGRGGGSGGSATGTPSPYDSVSMLKLCHRLQRADGLVGVSDLTALLTGMRACVTDADVQIAACETLRHLALNDENEVAIVTAGGVPCVVDALVAHPSASAVQLPACCALRNLSGSAMTAPDELLPRLVAAMTMFPGNADLQEACCETLRNLAVHNGNRGALLTHRGLLHAVLTAMLSHVDAADLLEAACDLLRLLAIAPEHHAVFVASGALDVVVRVINASLGEVSVLETACGVLRCLAARCDTHAAILSAGALSPLCAAADTNITSASLQESVCGVFASLAFGDPASCKAIGNEHGCLARIYTASDRHVDSYEVQLQVCRALHNLSKCSGGYGMNSTLHRTGAQSRLMRAKQRHPAVTPGTPTVATFADHTLEHMQYRYEG